MKMIPLFILLPALAMCQVTYGQNTPKLDELLVKSGKIRSDGIRGFIIRQSAEPVPVSSDKTAPTPVPPPAPVVPAGQYVPYSVYAADIKSNAQEISDLKVELTKTTLILDNLTANSGTMKDSLNTMTKLIEALTALLLAASAILGFFKFKKKE